MSAELSEWSADPEYQAYERIRRGGERRRSCRMGSEATVMVGINPVALGAAITQVQTTARYAHLATDPVKTAADQVAGNIAAAMNHAA